MKFLTILWLMIGVVMCTLLFRSIYHSMKSEQMTDYDKALIIGRLDTLKAMQQAYNAVNGSYASDFKTLSIFAVQAHLLSLSPQDSSSRVTDDSLGLFGFEYTAAMMQHFAYADRAKRFPFVFEVSNIINGLDTLSVYEISTPSEMGDERVLKIGNKQSKNIDGNWR